ncbi:Phycocyanobilin lyase CpcT [Galdieria sulphuraria]|nr:Phycocyanobilin lyase CpcT [Galdieria sulphuraria]
MQVVSKSVEEARLARFLAADWSNENQAIENPPFWSHMRVSYRPLPFELLEGFSLYSESCYQAFLKQPYRTGVYRILARNDGKLELELYKIEGEEEFYQGSRNIEKLRSLTRDRLVKLPNCCNTILSWDESKQMFSGETVPGKQCIVSRKGKETGRCPKTDKLLWGAIAGPFEFYPVARFSHEVRG